MWVPRIEVAEGARVEIRRSRKMGIYDTRLEEDLAKVEGGEEVLAARERELTGAPSRTGAARRIQEEDRLMCLARAGEVKLGPGKLPKNFWELPRPEDPKDSVRRALEEDRR